MCQSSRGGGCGDGGKGQRGCGRTRRTSAGGAAGPGGGPSVRGCVACRRRPGPGRLGRRARRARMRHVPAPARAQQVPGGTSTLGIALHLKDYGRTRQGPPRWRRRTRLAGASARRDVTCRDRQWERTRMRTLHHTFEYAVVCWGIRIPATAYKKGSNGSCLPRANTEPRLLRTCVLCLRVRT